MTGVYKDEECGQEQVDGRCGNSSWDSSEKQATKILLETDRLIAMKFSTLFLDC